MNNILNFKFNSTPTSGALAVCVIDVCIRPPLPHIEFNSKKSFNFCISTIYAQNMVQVVRSASSRTSRISSISKFNTKSFFPTHHSTTTTKKSHAHHLCVAPTEIAICTGAGEKSRENNRGVKSVLSFLSR